MTDTDIHEPDYYVVAQPTGHGRPETLTVTFKDKVVEYSNFLGVDAESKVHPDMLRYESREVYDRSNVEDQSYGVTD